MNTPLPRRPAIIYRPDLQPKPQRVVFSALTAIAWAIWLYLFMPLISLLAWWFGIELFTRHILSPEDSSHLYTLLRYAGIVIACALVIIAWSYYNLQRFGGLDRRKPLPPVTDAQLCERFGVDSRMLSRLRSGRQLVLELGENGELQAARPQDSLTSVDPRPGPPMNFPVHSQSL